MSASNDDFGSPQRPSPSPVQSPSQSKSPNSKSCPYKHEWESAVPIRAVRSPTHGFTVYCLLCERFGREFEDTPNGRKHRNAEIVAEWDGPLFRFDNIKLHMKLEHKKKYGKYCELQSSNPDKIASFLSPGMDIRGM